MNVLVHPAAEFQLQALRRQAGSTILLHGEAGIGKRTLALELARQLNCLGCSDESCRSCKMIAGGNHPLLVRVELDAKGKIGIEQIHELQHELRYEQYERQGKRIVIITNADRATLPAQNALLKTLEEPPAETTIILTATSPTALLATVLSRCIGVYLPALPGATLLNYLNSRYPTDQNGVDAAVALCGGNPGRALSYLADPTILQQDKELEQRVEELLAATDTFERLRLAAGIASASDNRDDYLRLLTATARQRARNSDSAGDNLAAVESLHRRLRANVSPKTAFEALAVELV